MIVAGLVLSAMLAGCNSSQTQTNPNPAPQPEPQQQVPAFQSVRDGVTPKPVPA